MQARPSGFHPPLPTVEWRETSLAQPNATIHTCCVGVDTAIVAVVYFKSEDYGDGT